MSPRSGQLFQALQKELSQSIWSVFSKTFSRVVALFNMEQLFPGESVIVLSCGLFSWPPERQNASSIDCASEEQNATHLPGLIILKLLLGTELCLAVGQASHTVDQHSHRQLSAEQVVETLVRMNLERAQALLAYQSTRVYRLEYKGFPGGRTAEMVVKVKYQAPATKEFEVISQTGSKMLIDRVFKKLLQ